MPSKSKPKHAKNSSRAGSKPTAPVKLRGAARLKAEQLWAHANSERLSPEAYVHDLGGTLYDAYHRFPLIGIARIPGTRRWVLIEEAPTSAAAEARGQLRGLLSAHMIAAGILVDGDRILLFLKGSYQISDQVAEKIEWGRFQDVRAVDTMRGAVEVIVKAGRADTFLRVIGLRRSNDAEALADDLDGSASVDTGGPVDKAEHAD